MNLSEMVVGVDWGATPDTGVFWTVSRCPPDDWKVYAGSRTFTRCPGSNPGRLKIGR